MQQTWVDHDNVLLVVAMQLPDKFLHLDYGELFSKCEDLESIHVVDICLY
jgi:hypothetical protein